MFRLLPPAVIHRVEAVSALVSPVELFAESFPAQAASRDSCESGKVDARRDQISFSVSAVAGVPS